jgi:rSAM/selenodomain-associated transferase 2
MLSVVVPTLNSARTLPGALAALVPAALDGLVRQVVVADGGSADATLAIAGETGADIVAAPRGRGSQLAAGARAARCDFLLFLHADTVLEPGFERELHAFCAGEGRFAGLAPDRAAAFAFAVDEGRGSARLLEWAVAWRCRLFALPYGDQGLVISRRLYERLGGFKPIPLMEDVELVRRIGRSRLTMLDARAVTSAERYRRGGYLRRSARNALCLALYLLGVPPGRIARLYG